LIRATITISDPVGGPVTYYWRSSDGFVSPAKTVWFAPGQTSAVVRDTWTLGAANANGSLRWEQAVVTSPQTLVSNRASFVYTCPPMIANMYVDAVQTAGDCSPGGAGYLVTATITIFAPAGGSFTYTWQDSNGSGTYTVAKTITIAPGHVFANVIAQWSIGSESGELPSGVQVVTGDGQKLSTAVVNEGAPGSSTPTPSATPGCTPTPTPTPTPVTVDGVTIKGATASVDQPVYDCIRPQSFTFTGQVAVDTTGLTVPETITYHWVRPDGSSGPDQTATINPGDATVTIPADDPWSPAPNPADGGYGEYFVITAVDSTPLAASFQSTPAQYTVLCPTQP
jgi:hypothetical protein